MSTNISGDANRARTDFWLILLLAAVTAIGPFAMHALAPALPLVGKGVGTRVTKLHMTFCEKLGLRLASMRCKKL